MFMKKITEENNKGEPFNIYAYFKRFTMDTTIWSCGFGVDTDMQNNSENPYLTHSQELLEGKLKLNIILALFITELRNFWVASNDFISACRYWLRKNFPITKRFINENPFIWIMNEGKKIIDKRQLLVGQAKRTDLLQLMLESATDQDFIHVFILFL